jgi:hypothetical protein
MAERGFCRACGTPLLLRYDRSDEAAVLAGTLDHPKRFWPTHHYGSESRLAWADCGSGLLSVSLAIYPAEVGYWQILLQNS